MTALPVEADRKRYADEGFTILRTDGLIVGVLAYAPCPAGDNTTLVSIDQFSNDVFKVFDRWYQRLIPRGIHFRR
jgi:hypothetical protein